MTRTVIALTVAVSIVGCGCKTTKEVSEDVAASVTVGVRSPDPAEALSGGCDTKAKVVEFYDLGGVDVLKWGLKWVVKKIDEKFMQELKTYTSQYSASARVAPFYGPGAAVPPTSPVECFRFARYEKNGNAEPAMEFIGEFKFDRGYMQVRPRRLVMHKGNYEKQKPGDKVSVVLRIKLEADWLQGNYGMREVLADERLANVKIKMGSPQAKLFKEDKYKWERLPYHPPVPFAVDTRGNRVNLEALRITITVTEAADPPELLKSVADEFHDRKDDLPADLAEAILGKDDEDK